MKDYTYTEQELEFVRHIKSAAPTKIWWDFTTYVFDYGDFYYQLECVSEIADSQNQSDEAIIGQFTKHNEAFTPGQHAKLVCENRTIQELYIVRVVLYFTTFETYSTTKVLLNKAKTKAKELLTGKPDPFGVLLAGSVGGCQEITCHPKSEQASKVDPKYSNLIEVGLLLQIDGKFIKAFVESNGYGFPVWEDKFFFDIEELKETALQYEFIKV